MVRRCCVLIVAGIVLSAVGCSSEPSEPTGTVAKPKKPAAVHALSPGSADPPRDAAAPEETAVRIAAVSGEEKSVHSRVLADLNDILDPNEIRLQPVSGKGPAQDLMEVLQNPQIDAAVVQTDALLALKGHAQAAAREKLRYLFRVPNKELHVLAARSIDDIRRLDGRRVNIDRPGTGTHLTARLVFERLGIAPDYATDDQATARRKLESGEIDAAILLASPPAIELFPVKPDERYHLVPIPWDDALSDYPPSRLTAEEYPHLVEPERPVPTIAVSRVLAVREWPEDSPAYRRLTHFAEAIHARYEELRTTGRDLRWKELTAEAAEPGWRRFPAVQAMLNRDLRVAEEPRAFESFMAASGLCALPESTVARVRFYNDFVEWRRVTGTRATALPPERDAP